MKNPRDGLQAQHDLLVGRIKRLREAQAIETDPSRRFQYETQITQEEKELRKVDRRLNIYTKYAREIAIGGGAVVVLVLVGMYVYYASHHKPPEKPATVTNTITQTNQGNAAGQIYTGTVYITNTKGVSEETFQRLAEELGVTKAALKSFFKILEEKQVPAEDLDRTLREIAVRYKDLLEKVKLLQSDDPEVQNLKTQAQQALENGEFDKAEQFLNEASAKDVAAAKQLQAVAEKRLLSAAEAKARNGQSKLTQLAYVQAAGYFQEAIELLPKGYDEILADYLNGAGYALHLVGQYTQSEPLYQQALMIRENVLGKEHSDVATSLNNLASLYANQSKYAQAELLYHRALAIREKVFGTEHPNVATSLNNLAALYYAQGQYAQVEPLYERALAIDEKILGKVHPNVAGDLNNIASLYKTQGKYDQAEPLYQRALAIVEKVFGKEHPHLATCLNNLALLYYTQGKYEQAKPLFERALTIAKKVFPADHPNVRLYSKNYADLLSKLAAAAPVTPAPTPP